MQIIRPIDNFGRLVLPKEYREALGITETSSLVITLHKGCMILENANCSVRPRKCFKKI